MTQEGNRLLIRFEADALDASLPAAGRRRADQGIRLEGNAAIVVDLGPRFASFRASDQPGERAAARIVSTSPPRQTRPRAPGQPAPPPQEAPPLLDLPPAGGLRAIVIDAGHGGDDDGAKGAGRTLEKNVTLSVARRLKAALEARLGVRVLLTRDGDQAVGLDQRAALANNNKADLFISLHANASLRPAVAGAEVFYLSLEGYGEQARSARSQAPRRDAAGARRRQPRDRDHAVGDWRRRATSINPPPSREGVEGALRERVPMSPRALQQAPFRVLVGANMPAVLVEMGFLTNAEQEQQLAATSTRTPSSRRWSRRSSVSAIAAAGRHAMNRAQARSSPAVVVVCAGRRGCGSCSRPAALVRRAGGAQPRRTATAATAGRRRPRYARSPRRCSIVAEDGHGAGARAARSAVRRDRRRAGARASSRRSSRGAAAARRPRFPPGTKLRDVFVTERGDAFVDLSGEITAKHPGGSLDEIFTVYTSSTRSR